MKRYFSFLLLLFTILGCGSRGPIVSIAKVSPQERPAKVIVIRQKSPLASGNSYTITLDEKENFFIRNGDYTTFEVTPGKHLIGVIWHGLGFGMRSRDIYEDEDMLDISFGPGEERFFLVNYRIKIDEISRNDGLKYVSSYNYVPMAQ
jgi:hypothetical protein